MPPHKVGAEIRVYRLTENHALLLGCSQVEEPEVAMVEETTAPATNAPLPPTLTEVPPTETPVPPTTLNCVSPKYFKNLFYGIWWGRSVDEPVSRVGHETGSS